MPRRQAKTPRPKGPRRVTILPMANSPTLSERIGYLASQQRRAYNRAVEWLNRDPGWPWKRAAARPCRGTGPCRDASLNCAT